MKKGTVIGIVVVAVGAVVVVTVALIVAVMNHVSTASTKSSSSTSASTPPSSQPSSGTNVAIVGGTNGPSCDSGGYFKPASVSINSGDTITFSVPANDPYSGGLQINGLPGGSVVVPRGGSMTTSAITASVTLKGTWPDDTECMKGSETVTVK